jgi:hypothetical protein
MCILEAGAKVDFERLPHESLKAQSSKRWRSNVGVHGRVALQKSAAI